MESVREQSGYGQANFIERVGDLQCARLGVTPSGRNPGLKPDDARMDFCVKKKVQKNLSNKKSFSSLF